MTSRLGIRCRRRGLAVLAAAAAVVPGAAGQAPVAAQRIAEDTLAPEVPGAHGTIVEPDSFSFGRTTIAAFQVGRAFGGGASAIGFATSTDDGGTWSSGLLPGLTAYSPSPGQSPVASDPVVAYDPERRVWLVASLSGSGGRNVIFVSRSSDGLTWDAPVIARAKEPRSIDKEWLACDTWPSSPLRGRCYLAYADFERENFGGAVRLAVQSSIDGGLTWTPPALVPISYDPAVDTLGPYPVVRPNGELVVVFTERDTQQAARSRDGGATFARERIASLQFHAFTYEHERLRAPPLPAADVTADGTVYVTWYDCRFRAGCAGNDIVVSRSLAGGGWSEPARVPLATAGAQADYVLPALAVGTPSRGPRTELALGYYALSSPDCTGPDCRLRAGLAVSSDGGTTWRDVALDAEPMQLEWLAPTSIGRMIADYVSLSFVEGRVLAVFSLARPPQGGRFDVALYAFSINVGAPLGAQRRGTPGPDRLVGGQRADVLLGLAGNDRLDGRAGNDLLEGGPGNDVIVGGRGRDRLRGGDGSDSLHSRDGERDSVDCGRGRDRAFVDRHDTVRGCESVRR